jgi:hypothetical protein
MKTDEDKVLQDSDGNLGVLTAQDIAALRPLVRHSIDWEHGWDTLAAIVPVRFVSDVGFSIYPVEFDGSCVLWGLIDARRRQMPVHYDYFELSTLNKLAERPALLRRDPHFWPITLGELELKLNFRLLADTLPKTQS